MREEELQIDRSCHIVYSKRCREVIEDRIRSHYGPENVDAVFEQVQHQYEKYLAEYSRKDLGGKKNRSNGTGGTYDCFMIVCYYVVCKEKTSFQEIEQMTEEVTVGSFGNLNFVDIEKPIFKRLMYLAFSGAKKKCDKIHDFDMHLDPYSKDKPLHYCFTRCPFADFIHQFGLEEIAGALCNVDYASMRAMNVQLVRSHTCIESDHCDYTFYSLRDPSVKDHPEYVDEQGFIRNI